MVRHTCQILPLGVLLCCTPLQADPPATTRAKQNQDAPVIEARFNNGSLVRMNLVPEPVEVQTVYGKLSIPPRDIRSIEFGLHIEPEVEAKVSAGLLQLSSSSYKQREHAVLQLIALGAAAYPGLKEAARSKDMETASRAQKALKEIESKVPAKLLNRRFDDVIRARKFTVVGRIVNSAIQARAEYFGELKLKPSQLQSLRPLEAVDELEVVLDAATHGSSPDQWLETSVELSNSQTLRVTAAGQVDLWPQQPGGYVSGPGGRQSTRAPMTGPMAPLAATQYWNSGSLVGKIGAGGTPFMIGDNFKGKAPASGRLYLHVLMSPWNNASTGSYTVRISASEDAGE